jgi:hypothetical protein
MRHTRLVLAATLLVAAACSSDGVSPSTSLTISGSASAPPSAGVTSLIPGNIFGRASMNIPPEMIVGDPSHVNIGMYALYLSPNEDCSAPVTVADNGNTAQVKDFAQHPVLFAGTPAAGTYKCVIFRMSDVVRFQSHTPSAHCAANTDYAIDIYRAPDTDWRDINVDTITATGSDASPSDDKVYLFASTDPSAVIARGMSSSQVLHLTGALTVPGSGTFYWDGTGSVTDDGTACGMEPPELSFR